VDIRQEAGTIPTAGRIFARTISVSASEREPTQVPFSVGMNDVQIKQHIRGWLLEMLDEPEYQHAFPVAINVFANGRIEVFLDSDEAVDFALCRRVSRHLEAHLDETQILGERYTLEVSSPGASRPLTLPRQFHKHIGRTLEVQLNTDERVQGELVSIDDEGLTLREEVVTRNEKNKRVKETLTHQVAFGEFRGATVQISFKKPS